MVAAGSRRQFVTVSWRHSGPRGPSNRRIVANPDARQCQQRPFSHPQRITETK
jgi:hypothetical protein